MDSTARPRSASTRLMDLKTFISKEVIVEEKIIVCESEREFHSNWWRDV